MSDLNPALISDALNASAKNWRRKELFRVRLAQCIRNYENGGDFVDDDGYDPDGLKPDEEGFRSDLDDMNTDFYDEDGYDLAGFDRNGNHRNGIDSIRLNPPWP